MLNAASNFLLSKYYTYSNVIKTKWLLIEERLKYAICQFASKILNDPQFPEYIKLKTKKDRQVLRNNKEQTEPIDHNGKI